MRHAFSNSNGKRVWSKYSSELQIPIANQLANCRRSSQLRPLTSWRCVPMLRLCSLGTGSTMILQDFILQPWHFLLAILAGWMNRQQQDVIDYVRTENQILRETLGKSRIVLNDDQRRRLAVKAKILPRKLLENFGTLFIPDAILRWHRESTVAKWGLEKRDCPTLHGAGRGLVISTRWGSQVQVL